MIAIIIGCLSYAIPTLWNKSQKPSNKFLASDLSSKSISPFDLSFTLIHKKEILSGGPAKDGIPALTHPQFIAAQQADYLQPDSEIIGVKIGDDIRAYPINVLNWHEIINDTVDGVPIVVTYCPLCRSALVFDRKVGDETLEFGVSGLLWNSNVLMYDRQKKERDESLWSQIKMKAVTGPAAQRGDTLVLRSSQLTTWQQWQKTHPETRVVSEQTGYDRGYRQGAYASYFQTDRLMFPVTQHGQKPERFRNKEPMLLVQSDQTFKAYALRDIDSASTPNNYLQDTIAQTQLCLKKSAGNASIEIIDMKKKDRQLPVAYMFWFSLNAILPDVEIYQQ